MTTSKPITFSKHLLTENDNCNKRWFKKKKREFGGLGKLGPRYQFIHLHLYHATENTANQNTEKPLYTRRYQYTNLPIMRSIDSVCRCIFYGLVKKIGTWNILFVTCIFLIGIYTRLLMGCVQTEKKKNKWLVGYSIVCHSKTLYN